MGAAGDMLTAALLELTEDKEQIVAELNDMGIPGVEFRAVPSSKCGVVGTHMEVTVDGISETVIDVDEHNHADPHPHVHTHEHGHNHSHEHTHSHEHNHTHSHDQAHSHDHDHSHSHSEHEDGRVHSHALDEDWGQPHTHEHSHEHSHEHTHDHDHTHSHDHDHNHDHGHDYSHEHGHEHSQEHGHSHENGHSHSHRGMGEINEIIAGLNLPEQVKKDASAIYEIIAQAESHVHGEPVDKIHFHEVGNMDAIADVTAAALLMNKIRPDKVIVSPINTGHGQVKCAHGIIPVPAPATAHILQGIPTYSNWVKGELLTPTGAAILIYYADEFGQKPIMAADKTGYGMGTKDFEAANCVRAFIGKGEDSTDSVVELSCNVDDMTGEEIGYAIEKLMEGGARDAFAAPVIMKKSRPGHVITVIASPEDKERIVRLIFKVTTTIGIRETLHPRYVLDRQVCELDTEFGKVRCKVSEGYGVRREKLEYDDIAKIADENDLSIAQVRERLRK